MNVKKLCFVIMTVLVMITTTCFAQVTVKDLNIGGIYIGQPIDEFIQSYGNPKSRMDTPPKGFDFVYSFDGSKLFVRPDNFALENALVSRIIVEGLINSNLVMSSGIKLDSTIEDVLKVYGEPLNAEETKYFLLDAYYPAIKIEYHAVDSQDSVLVDLFNNRTVEGPFLGTLQFYFINGKVCAIYMF